MSEDGLDAEVLLGLMAKAAEVFATDDTFLSFPLAPLPFRRDDLAAMTTGATSEGLRALGEFSLLVNLITKSALWLPFDNTYLWDAYTDVLEAELALSDQTPAEQAECQAAQDYLYDTAPDGTVVESAQALAYRQYRDAWLVTLQEYKNRDGAAKMSTDPAVQAQWRDVDEPLLRTQLADLEQRWTFQGHRAQVDQARSLLQRFADRSPIAAWGRYRAQFDPTTPHIYYLTDPGTNERYVPSSFRPSNAVTSSWPRISLNRAQLSTLAATAPAELAKRIRSGPVIDSGVTEVAFEYCSAGVARSWFSAEPFSSRAWRFPDQRLLSDGANPPSGLCPAYVSGVVFVRSVAITVPATAPAAASQAPPGKSLLGALPMGPTPVEFRPVFIQESHSALRATTPPPPTRGRPAPTRAATLAAPRPQPPVLARPGAAAKSAVLPLQRADFTRLPIRVPPTPRPKPPPADQRTTTTPPEEVYLLAFISKRLPRSPDPDLSLTWD